MTLPGDPAIPLLGIPREFPGMQKEHMLHSVHSCIIYNSQKLERIQMSFNRGMDTETLVYIHIVVYYAAVKNNEFVKFLGIWIELESVILRKVTQ